MIAYLPIWKLAWRLSFFAMLPHSKFSWNCRCFLVTFFSPGENVAFTKFLQKSVEKREFGPTWKKFRENDYEYKCIEIIINQLISRNFYKAAVILNFLFSTMYCVVSLKILSVSSVKLFWAQFGFTKFFANMKKKKKKKKNQKSRIQIPLRCVVLIFENHADYWLI